MSKILKGLTLGNFMQIFTAPNLMKISSMRFSIMLNTNLPYFPDYYYIKLYFILNCLIIIKGGGGGGGGLTWNMSCSLTVKVPMKRSSC